MGFTIAEENICGFDNLMQSYCKYSRHTVFKKYLGKFFETNMQKIENSLKTERKE
jgi:hypothetical protein